MNGTMDAGEPSSTTGDIPDTKEGFSYGLGFLFVVFFFIFALSYCSYLYKRRLNSQSPLPPTTSSDTTIDSDPDDIQFTRGLDDDVLATFPTLVYSEIHADNYGSGCSICLADYKLVDVLRLLPQCGHFFHVSCIDPWLRVHPTCPVCRKSPLPTPTS